MNVVLFAPEDLQLVKGAPAIRRKFIDIELGKSSRFTCQTCQVITTSLNREIPISNLHKI